MKKTLSLSFLALSVLAGCHSTTSNITTALVPEKLVISPNDDRAYRTLKLNNEIEVVLVSDPKVEKSAAALSVGVGLLNDPMTQQGMAHYLEHMLFLGTERFPDSKEYSEFMTKNGGAHNAYTWLDITNYMFKVNNDAYGEALDRFSDFFKAPKLYPEYTEKEKSAVNAEWSMRREMDFFGQFKLARQMMGEHPANRFLIGNLETLGDKEKSKLHTETVDFFNQYYSSNIMKVAMISNQPLDEMETLAKQYFSDIQNKHIEKPTVTDKIDYTRVGGKKVFYSPNEDVKNLVLDFTIENNMAKFAHKPNRFIAYLIDSEMPGTPAQLLREKGWVSGLGAAFSANHYGNYGQFAVHANLTDEGMKHRDEIVATVMQYIELIKAEGVNSKYFNEIRTSLNNQFTFLEKGDEFNYVSNLAQAMQDYPLNNAINAPYYYGEFSEDAVKEVLAQLTPESLKVWYISKEEETDSQLHFYDGKYRIADITESDTQRWQQKSQFDLKLPTVNRLLPENFALKNSDKTLSEKPQLVHDTQGLKIWQFTSAKFAHQPKGLIELYVNNPGKQHSMDAAILQALWADLYAMETATLMTEASIAGMGLAFDDANGFTLSVNGFTDKQQALLTEALAKVDLSVDQVRFEQAIDRYTRSLANAGKKFPYAQAFSQYRKLTRSGSYDNATLIERAKQLTANDLTAFIADTLTHNQIRGFVFGNYDHTDIDALANKITSVLPKQTQITPYTRTKDWLPKPGEVIVLQKDIDVADVAIVDIHMHPRKGYQQKAQGLVLAGHFRNVVFDKLRTEEQLAYSVGGFSPTMGDYAGFGMYIQTPVKGAKAMQQRFDEFKGEYTTALNSITPEVFAQLKNAALVSLKEQPKNLREEMAPFINDWYRENMAFDSKLKLINAVEQVTLAGVKDFYQQTMLNPDAARLNVQLRGKKFSAEPFADLPKQTRVSRISELKGKISFQ